MTEPADVSPRDPAEARRALGRLRRVGIVEGASFLVLLGIAMPLKYFAGIPLAVRIVGSIHGGLFLWFLVELFTARRMQGWKLPRVATVFAAAVLPFGTFVLDPSLRREQDTIR